MKVIEKELVRVGDTVASNLLVKASTKLNAKVDQAFAQWNFMGDECDHAFQVMRYTWDVCEEKRWPERIRNILRSKGFVGNTAVFLTWLLQSRELDSDWYATIPLDNGLLDGSYPYFDVLKEEDGPILDLAPLGMMSGCDRGAFVGFRRVS